MVYDGRKHRRLRMILDYAIIIGTLSVIFIEKNAIWIMLPILIFYILLNEIEERPKKKTVWRYHSGAKKFIKYAIDEKTGKYMKKVKE